MGVAHCIHEANKVNANQSITSQPLYINLMTRSFLLIVLYSNFRCCELTSRGATLEQKVDLAVGPTLHLRQAEERDDEAK